MYEMNACLLTQTQSESVAELFQKGKAEILSLIHAVFMTLRLRPGHLWWSHSTWRLQWLRKVRAFLGCVELLFQMYLAFLGSFCFLQTLLCHPPPPQRQKKSLLGQEQYRAYMKWRLLWVKITRIPSVYFTLENDWTNIISSTGGRLGLIQLQQSKQFTILGSREIVV